MQTLQIRGWKTSVHLSTIKWNNTNMKALHSGEKKHVQISQLSEIPDFRRDWSIEVVGVEVPADSLVDKHNMMQNVIPDMIHTCRHFKQEGGKRVFTCPQSSGTTQIGRALHSGEKKHVQLSQPSEIPDFRRDWSIEVVVGVEPPADN